MEIKIDKNVFILMLGMIRTIDVEYSKDLADFYLDEKEVNFK